MILKKEAVHAAVTAMILEQMESALKWKMPWTPTIGGGLTNAITGKRYVGWINSMFLNIAMSRNGWDSVYWAGIGQWNKSNAKVKIGEKATEIFIPRIVTKVEEGIEKKILIGFASVKIWNSEQVEGWTPPVQETPVNQVAWHNTAEQIARETMATIQHGSDRACYSPLLDMIKMPNKESFIPTEHSDATENYYSTLFHELTHWTGAQDR